LPFASRRGLMREGCAMGLLWLKLGGAEALGPESTSSMRPSSSSAATMSTPATAAFFRSSAPTFTYAPLFM